MSFLLLKINLLLKFDFLLKYEAYPIKWTSDTWCFAGLYLLCGSFQRLRWSTAVCCSWRNRKPVHVIRKILWKTLSVMIGKILTFWRVKMQMWLIYDTLLVNECCGTLGTAVNEAYFALFSMGAHVTRMTPYRSDCVFTHFAFWTIEYLLFRSTIIPVTENRMYYTLV